jgi:hypothetical protein
LQLGLDGTVGVRVGNDELKVGGQVFVLVSAISQGVRFSGKVLGQWNEPFGLAGLQLRDLVVGGGVDVDTSIEVALAGGATIGKYNYDLAGLVSVIGATGGLVPKKLAFKFEGSELSQITQLQLMSALIKSAVSGPLANAIPAGDTQALLRKVENVDLIGSVEKLIPLPLLKYQDVAIFLATPGASFPDIDFGGLGVGVRGSLSFMNRRLSTVDNFLTLRDGLKVYGKPGSVDIGLVKLTGAELEIRVPMPGLPLQQGDKARLRIKGSAGLGCSFLAGAMDIEVTREEASFERDVQLAGYKTSVVAHANLAKFPTCLLEGRFGDDLLLDALEAVKLALKAKADKALAQVKQKAAEAKAAVAAGKQEIEDARAAAKQRRRDAAQARLNELKSFIKSKEDNAKGPILEAAWRKAREAVQDAKLAKDGAVAGVAIVRQKLDDFADVLKKLPGDVAASTKTQVDAARVKLEQLAAAGKAAVAEVEDELGVTEAKARLKTLEATLKNFAQRLVQEKVDPVAAYATTLLDSFSVDQIGFDGGLDSLCDGTLPKLNIRGQFAGKEFNFQKALDLAKRGELAQRNTKALEALVTQLLNLVDTKAAAAFNDALASE